MAADHEQQATQLVKDDEVCDMELTNCETNVHANLLGSFSLCSPESLLKPLIDPETTNNDVLLDAVVHQSVVSCEPSATNKELLCTGNHSNEKFSNVTMDITCEDNAIPETNSNMHTTGNDKIQLPLPSATDANEAFPYCTDSHTLKSNDVTMDITCVDTALVETNSDMHSMKTGEIQPRRTCGADVICRHNSSYRDGSINADHQDMIKSIPLTSAAVTNVATDELKVVMSASQHTEMIVRNLLKAKQRQPKSGLLVASPYLEQHTVGGIVHAGTYVLSEKSLQRNTVICVDNSMIQDSSLEENSQSLKDQECKGTAIQGGDVDLTTNKGKVCPSFGETLFLAVNYEGDNTVHVCNWLEDVNNNSFALVDSKSPSQTHTDSVYSPSHELSSTVRCAQPLASSMHQHTRSEDFCLQKAVAAVKANTELAKDQKPKVKSPKVVTIRKKSELLPSDHSVSLNSVSSVEDNSTYQKGDVLCQGVMMSPSVFSKFLTTLKCNRSILCANEPHIVKGLCSPCDISVLSSSPVHADIDRKQAFLPDGTCTHHVSRSKQSVTGPLSVMLEILRER